MNICIYDATETSAVGLSWKIGARLYKAIGRFDAIHGATSWVDAWDWLERVARGKHIDTLQFWGHGSQGMAHIGYTALIHDRVLAPDDSKTDSDVLLRIKQLTSCSLIWFRTCNTARGKDGQKFMASWADFFGCKVAAHTHVIGLWHSGLQTLSPGETPTWSTDATRKVSSPTEPRTIPFWANSFPKEW